MPEVEAGLQALGLPGRGPGPSPGSRLGAAPGPRGAGSLPLRSGGSLQKKGLTQALAWEVPSPGPASRACIASGRVSMYNNTISEARC